MHLREDILGITAPSQFAAGYLEDVDLRVAKNPGMPIGGLRNRAVKAGSDLFDEAVLVWGQKRGGGVTIPRLEKV